MIPSTRCSLSPPSSRMRRASPRAAHEDRGAVRDQVREGFPAVVAAARGRGPPNCPRGDFPVLYPP
jgi:hypothetical protein